MRLLGCTFYENVGRYYPFSVLLPFLSLCHSEDYAILVLLVPLCTIRQYALAIVRSAPNALNPFGSSTFVAMVWNDTGCHL